MTKRLLTAALLLSVSALPAFAAKTSLVVGMPIEPPGLDPTVAAPVAIREVTWVNLYEGLVRIDRTGKVQPLLAKSWEVAPEGRCCAVFSRRLVRCTVHHRPPAPRR